MNLLQDIEHLGEICICGGGQTVRGCPQHAPVFGDPMPVATPESIHAMLIRVIAGQKRIIENQEKLMADTTALQAADEALQAEVATAITDWQTTLASANGDQAVVDQVTADMQATVAKLQASDPTNATTGAGTGTSNTGSGSGGDTGGGTTTITTDPGTTPAS